MKVNATAHLVVDVDPIEFLKDLVIHRDNWIDVIDVHPSKKEYRVLSIGDAYPNFVCGSNKEQYDAWQAAQLLIKFFERGKKVSENTGII